MSKKEKIRSNEIYDLGFSDRESVILVGKVAKKLLKSDTYNKKELFAILRQLVMNPGEFVGYKNGLEKIAGLFLVKKARHKEDFSVLEIPVREKPLEFRIFGEEYIDCSALDQMENAMKLPVSLKGALMPDAHSGYGLPIGGVLATKSNIVIPYAVGVDIACRMCMSVFDLPADDILHKKSDLKKMLGKHTVFGVGGKCDNHLDDSVFDKQEWNLVHEVRRYRDLAYSQLGTSGGGNHFAEWGILEILKKDELLELEEGKYLALLTHSGSRGFGSEIATFYSGLAMSEVKLPRELKHLAWLDLDTEAGQEYWIAMNLAGDYASANHHEIHRKIAKALSRQPLKIIENHHNYAWKEKLPDGREVIVHRKGATPAGKNNIGIIPGSMATNGFIVRGRSEESAISSASHGAGRLMSRNRAKEMITKTEMTGFLEEHGVELIGGDVDESPAAYKDINMVMSFQSELVDILARFSPKIVRMAGAEKWDKRAKKYRDA